MKKQLSLMAAVLASFLPFSGLHAQLVCSGTACAALPVSTSELDTMFYSIETQYFNEVLRDMSDASVMAGVQLSPSGVVNLREFTIGGQAAAGATEVRKLDVAVPNYGVIQDMPSAGMAVVPRLFVGTNLGYLLSGEPHDWTNISRFGLHRFDFYLSGLNASLGEMKQFAKPKKNEDYNGFSRSIGAEVRYHLVEGGDRDAFLFAFTGVSLGLGYNRVEQKLEYTRSDSKIKVRAGSGTTIIWNGQDRITYRTKTDVFPVTIRTGFQFLYLFRFSAGAGVAWGRGSSDLELKRYGRAYVDSDTAAVLGLTLPDAFLDMTLKGSGGPSRPTQPFATVGFEVNIPFLKIFIDAAGNKTMYSASAGIRMVF